MPEYMYDIVTLGRCSIDLYANDIGVPFPEIRTFGAYLGGNPLNIAVGARRLGLVTALVSAVGDDIVGDFVLTRLAKEGVETRFISRKTGTRTPAVLLGIEPPDHFPLVFYRENAADFQLTIDDVASLPFHAIRTFLLSGTALARDPSRSAALYALERAHANGCMTYLDLDFRPDQWGDPRSYGVITRLVLPLIDVVIGTEAEVNALFATRVSDIQIPRHQLTAPQVWGDLHAHIDQILCSGPKALIVKQGAAGATAYLPGHEAIRVSGFVVTVVNTLGAGDAFAAGLIYGRLQGWDWYRSIQFANACGAIIVTRIGCADFMPTRVEVEQFLGEHITH
ncbi:5-dehydro-2-deoxygluconokinase [Thermorudis peleae]|uniref:5-dehydro-2-deoxygluconokinase n=1 Tax=Thermorudis peleae TaxID=1382356 RepID=UPI00056FACFC|nr:5-dehydro-2-deoxygluconokinase [Thermorudis peleae]